jgi:hypothetical protein
MAGLPTFEGRKVGPSVLDGGKALGFLTASQLHTTRLRLNYKIWTDGSLLCYRKKSRSRKSWRAYDRRVLGPSKLRGFSGVCEAPGVDGDLSSNSLGFLRKAKYLTVCCQYAASMGSNKNENGHLCHNSPACYAPTHIILESRPRHSTWNVAHATRPTKPVGIENVILQTGQTCAIQPCSTERAAI